MKWPEELTFIRHGQSDFNAQRDQMEQDPLYQELKKAYETNPESEESRKLAYKVMGQYSLEVSDHNTHLTEVGTKNSQLMAERLSERIRPPSIIFVSPYERTRSTLEAMMGGWPELRSVPVVEEERIREQDHGLALIYANWRIFNILNPEQKRLREIQGPYWYRYPQGENIPDLRERLRSWLTTLTRDFNGQRVLAVTHHLTILGVRANLERLSASEFERLDHEQKPINSGVTIYRGDPTQGQEGKLILDAYNLDLYTQ